jgi:hypothetical protein
MRVSLVKAIAKVKGVAQSKLDDKELKELDGLLDKVVAVKEVKEDKEKDKPKDNPKDAPKGNTPTPASSKQSETK